MTAEQITEILCSFKKMSVDVWSCVKRVLMKLAYPNRRESDKVVQKCKSI